MTGFENQKTGSIVEHERLKHEHFLETGELHSEILGVVGEIPNPEELMGLKGGDFNFYDTSLFVSGDGEKIELAPQEDPEEDAIEPERVLQVLSPMVALLARDFATRMDLPQGVNLKASVGGHTGIVEGIYPGDEIAEPHRDYIPDDQHFGIFYVASIGAPTKIWEGDFNISESFNGGVESRQETERLLKEQVEEQGLVPTEIPASSVICIDSQTVHASPEADLGVAGNERTFASIRFEVLTDGEMVE
ncbi:hypothetical protein H6800_01335 [Candidatus Nomurabacteria bacterium]|nr:hypothetical protein [Candidatus Nomurabacteria bacterium]